jgi:hypothetical protein
VHLNLTSEISAISIQQDAYTIRRLLKTNIFGIIYNTWAYFGIELNSILEHII